MRISQLQTVQNSQNFGVKISAKTVKMANERSIAQGYMAKELGLPFVEYCETIPSDYVKVGDKTYNFRKIADEIVSDREKLNEAFGKAWNKFVKPFLKK